ncbi:12.5 kDa retinal tissue protein, putative [Pediculus humanus corporis]|uniref:12.5 kDa retinal tissue protein, putative n=1 Tax=Pediculus humanus subsp. corporis TaxID=121224 RepID=E0V9C9_PEDHC|nr:12.5 kDa retinal tissue protein, putative [Pediculus humanus corporis]EEB09985.1 12.5 kDa retinal tissue protein, putative [Pediculus humanus corporis]
MEPPIFIKANSVGSSIIEESLLSMEELDRTSPELWPEQIPGVSEYIANTTSFGKGQTWMKGLDNDDKAFLLYLSKLTPSGLVSEVKKLYDTAYQLGCEESKEMTRGKYLKVLLKKSNSGST